MTLEPIVALAPGIIDYHLTDNYDLVNNCLKLIHLDIDINFVPLLLLTIGATLLMYEIGRTASHSIFEGINGLFNKLKEEIYLKKY